MTEVTFNKIAIIGGPGDFVDGAAVLAMLNAGVTDFIEGVEEITEERPAEIVVAESVKPNNGYKFEIVNGSIVKA